MKYFFILLFLGVLPSLAEEPPALMTLDSLGDVYYKETGEELEAVVADEIKALSGKKISVVGYMVPFNNLENLKEFMLMPSSNGCNFCESPMKEEMVYIRQKGNKKFPFLTDPLVVTGTLWVQGTTPASNSTYAQFLYALKDAKIEKLHPDKHNILEVVTPRTIIKQVCSLLRVRLLKQVTFKKLNQEEFFLKRSEMLLKYLNGEEGLKKLKFFLKAFNLPESETLLPLVSNYIAGWSAAIADPSGEMIYYLKDLDLTKKENQRQIAIASYDLLFHQELDMSGALHKGSPSYDERLARLSLILGLRQSFTQFYGSIGLLKMLPMSEFASSFKKVPTLPVPYKRIQEQLLQGNASFIEELYKTERYQPYTKAIEAPPKAMEQLLKHQLYTEKVEEYTPPQLDGFSDRLGGFLTSVIVGIKVEELGLKKDGIRLSENDFQWKLEFNSSKKAQTFAKKLKDNLNITIVQDKINVTIQSKMKVEKLAE